MPDSDNRPLWLRLLAPFVLTAVVGPLAAWVMHTTADNRDRLNLMKVELEWREKEGREWRIRMEDKLDSLIKEKERR